MKNSTLKSEYSSFDLILLIVTHMFIIHTEHVN